MSVTSLKPHRPAPSSQSLAGPVISRSVTPPTKGQARRGLLPRALVLTGAVLILALAIYPLELGREALARDLIGWSYTVTGGAPVRMRVAGWLMFVAGPLAAVWFGHDFRRAIATARAPRPDGLTRFAGRRRARGGHHARRPIGFWLRRAPLAVPIVVALAFLVPFGLVGHGPANWATLPGGGDFLRGVKWSLIATFVAGALVIVAESVMVTEPKRWVSRGVSAVALLAPIGALAFLLSN